ncbi:hypothetical protein [Pseudomonas trivialis]|uniref:Uncharacterized protein n=1 Tax=Pseudomonas trivialis TaxID=200450 RepID=A0A0H5AFP0_9PSED|nr:hypothetical protein [Pseudomonas trivialis]AKS09941.1 hypothetical protein AA957_28785 [Pseudomonas trivialis]
MNKAPAWLRTTLSIPVYATSVVFWMLTVYMSVPAWVKILSRFVTPEKVGEGVVDLLLSGVLAAVGSALWMLGRYIRTSNARQPPKPSAAQVS